MKPKEKDPCKEDDAWLRVAVRSEAGILEFLDEEGLYRLSIPRQIQTTKNRVSFTEIEEKIPHDNTT
jgi:protease II